jgi:two-component system LytT family response regulator
MLISPSSKILPPIKVLIVDDEVAARNRLHKMLEDTDGFQVVGLAENAREGIRLCLEHRPGLLLLDIQMPIMDGFDMLKELRALNLRPSVIFTTSYSEFAIKAIRHAAFDFLLKPIDDTELKIALLRFQDTGLQTGLEERLNLLLSQVNRISKVTIKSRHETHFIDPEDIVYCEAAGNYTNIITNINQKITASMSIGEVTELLPTEYLHRVHRSFILNLKRVEKINKQENIYCLKKGKFLVTINLRTGFISEITEE